MNNSLDFQFEFVGGGDEETTYTIVLKSDNKEILERLRVIESKIVPNIIKSIFSSYAHFKGLAGEDVKVWEYSKTPVSRKELDDLHVEFWRANPNAPFEYTFVAYLNDIHVFGYGDDIPSATDNLILNIKEEYKLLNSAKRLYEDNWADLVQLEEWYGKNFGGGSTDENGAPMG